MEPHVIVVGAGVFGLSAAIHALESGCRVLVVESGPVVREDEDADVVRRGLRFRGTSVDASRIVRPDYGAHGTYTGLMRDALASWRAWSTEARRTGHPPPYHEVGWMVLRRSADMPPGSFERESYNTLQRHGFSLTPLRGLDVAASYPAWSWTVRPRPLRPPCAPLPSPRRPMAPGRCISQDDEVCGYRHEEGGWADCTATLTFMLRRVRALGGEVLENAAVGGLVQDPSGRSGPRPSFFAAILPSLASDWSRPQPRSTVGVHLRGDATLKVAEAEDNGPALWRGVVLAAGAWSSTLLPALRPLLRPTAQPVFYLQPPPGCAKKFESARFPGAQRTGKPPWGQSPVPVLTRVTAVFAADTSRTGYYGFPLHDGLVKVSRHGPGEERRLDGPRNTSAPQRAHLRSFLMDTMPDLARAEVGAPPPAPAVAPSLALFLPPSDRCVADLFLLRRL